jgi:PIN domain nuclease of toxin-antitoxin system
MLHKLFSLLVPLSGRIVLQYLLDTHTLLWWLNNNQTLKESARQIISNSENAIFVSAVTAWEISIKKALGKSDAPND